MKLPLGFVLFALFTPVTHGEHVVLSDKVMRLTNYSAYLSALAYEVEPPKDASMDYLHNYVAEPDQGLVVKEQGYCFGVFRGTTLTWDDWSQNVEVGTGDVCAEGAEQLTCCKARIGYIKAYNTTFKSQMEDDIRECVKTCKNKDECLVLTGHSQGGAVAAVAGVALAELNPYVITFGQPSTLFSPCERVTSERWYRWVNTKESKVLDVAISYDPVPFVPALGAVQFGHMIVISSDDSGVAYIGLNAQNIFHPLNVNGFEAHSMFGTSEFPGYADRIIKIMSVYNDTGKYPVRDNGFIAGSFCTEDVECESGVCGSETALTWKRCVGVECKSDADCDSNRCDSGLCVPKLGSCQVCDEDSDCESGSCSWRFRCAENAQGLMADQCACNLDSDCLSGRCEGVKPPICEPKLGLGATCNEPSDCVTGHCSWDFTCISELTSTEQLAEEAKTPKGLIICGIILGCIVVIACIYRAFFWRRRGDYDEIPSRLNI